MREESQPNTIEKLLTEGEVAEAMQLCRATLSRHRRLGSPLVPFIQIGWRIRYRRADVDAALAAMVDDGTKADRDAERQAAADELALAQIDATLTDSSRAVS